METTHTVANDVLLGEVKNLLAEGHRVILKAKGASMLPFVRSEVDSLELELRKEVAVGDIVLAHLSTGHYVAHRVIGMDRSGITLKGDGNLDRTESCRVQDICGTAVRIIRPDERTIDCSGKNFRRISTVWRSLPRFFRRVLLSVFRRLS